MTEQLGRPGPRTAYLRSVDEAAKAVLLAHLKVNIEGCTCGWAELGKSHPEHQVAKLREAGLLKEGVVQ